MESCKIKYLLLRLLLSSLTCFLNQAPEIFAQNPGRETGLPFITQYTINDYKAFYQNWAAVKDSKGLMYFGNGDGVLVYDGTNWELILLPNQSTVFSLAKDKNERVYVGGVGEIGFLDADSSGRLNYNSLLHHLKKEDREFTRVNSAYSSSFGVYFLSPEALFLWTGRNFKIWKSGENKFTRAFIVNNNLIVRTTNGDLLQLKSNKLKPLAGSNFFSGKAVTVILPYDNRHLLIGTQDHGLYLYNEPNIIPFFSEDDSFLKSSKLYCGVILRDSTFALGTIQGGLVVIDRKGKQRLNLNGISKIFSPTIIHLYADNSGILWATLNDGIAKIEYPSPFSIFDSDAQLKGTVYLITRYQDKIYAGTDRGLFYMDISPPGSNNKIPVFRQVKSATQRIWSLLHFNNSLLAALDAGVYELRGNNFKKIHHFKTYFLRRSKIDPSRVFLGHTDGVNSIYYKNSKWIDEGKLPGVTGSVHGIVEMPSGDLWLATNVNWIWKVSFEDKSKALLLEEPGVKKYSIENGLPDDVGHLFLFEDQLLFSSILHSDNTYRYNEPGDNFIIDNTLDNIAGLHKQNKRLRFIDNDGNVWFEIKEDSNINSKMAAFKISNGQYRVEDLNQRRILNFIGTKLFYDKENNIIWHGVDEGIIKQDLSIKEIRDTSYITLVRKVIYQNDSVIFAGSRPSDAGKLFSPSLSFYENKFRFLYSAPYFTEEKAIQYQYYLEGFDKNWSHWSYETQRDYTNLSEGRYVFKVRAKNIYGQISKEDSYAFTILPPWFRTWWAYLLYILIIAGAVGLIVHWRSTHLLKEKEELEKIVKERTSQIAGQAEQLSKQAQQLAEQAEKLKEADQQKSRFFANISHEFRTPLTLIKGPVENSLNKSGELISREDGMMIRNNADRLLRLVNQLLDLSKIDAQSMEFNPSAGDIYSFFRTIGSAFSSHADQRQIKYNVNVPEVKLFVFFDYDKLEKVIYNILSNAFKFTPDNGKISIIVNNNAQSGAGSNGKNILTIEITDTGIGIPEDQQKLIFDRFFQSDNSLTREHEGTGIGLALTKELLNLMDGDIKVESKQGKGSKFIITLPVQPVDSSQTIRALKEIEIADYYITNESTPYLSGAGSQDIAEDLDASVIMIVEDNTDMRSFIKKQLIDEYRIIEASNGIEGLETAKKEIPDLIVTDLMMPQMDGISLCKNLKSNENTNHIPLIMLTAKAGQDQKIEGLETGADSYLTKPFDRKELKVLVRNLITQRKQLREKYSRELRLGPKNIPVSSLDEQFIRRVTKIIEDKLADSAFGVPEMQDLMAMSKTQLHRKMKAITNEAPGEFLRNYRLKRAAQILAQKGENVTQVAYSVGFNNLSYFAKCFKELYGVAPSEYNIAEL